MTTDLIPITYLDVRRAEDNRDTVKNILWKTKDHQLIKLGELDDDHLRNIALMLIGMGYQIYRAPDDLKVRWLTVLRLEWERRMRERHEVSA